MEISVKAFSGLCSLTSFFILLTCMLNKNKENPSYNVSQMINDMPTAIGFNTALVFYTLCAVSYIIVLTEVMKYQNALLTFLKAIHLLSILCLYTLLYLYVEYYKTAHNILTYFTFSFVIISDFIYLENRGWNNLIYNTVWILQCLTAMIFAINTGYVVSEYVFVLLTLLSKAIKIWLIYATNDISKFYIQLSLVASSSTIGKRTDTYSSTRSGAAFF